MCKESKDTSKEKGEFGELIKYTLCGYAGGLFLGVFLDYLGLQRIVIGQFIKADEDNKKV